MQMWTELLAEGPGASGTAGIPKKHKYTQIFLLMDTLRILRGGSLNNLIIIQYKHLIRCSEGLLFLSG